MTVHMIRIRCEMPDGVTIEQVRSAVQDWLDNHHPTLTNEEIDIRLAGDGDLMPVHLVGDFRFGLTDNRQTLLKQIEKRLEKYVDWYLLGYHGCAHDDTGHCQWTTTTPWGPVPEGISI